MVSESVQPDSNKLLDRRLEAVFRSKIHDEPLSEYSTNAEPATTTNQLPPPSSVNQMQSLAQSLRNDSEIDESRIIDAANNATAGLYEFIPSTKLKGAEDWVLESDHYKYYSQTTDFPLTIENEAKLNIADNLHMFTYEKGNVSTFMRPRQSSTGVSSHFLMDGASILPPICLDIQPGDRVLDACAAPGGKSLLMLQTLYPDLLVCNDSQESRLNRVSKLFREYLYDFDEKWLKKRCLLIQNDARTMTEYGMYDKVCRCK